MNRFVRSLGSGASWYAVDDLDDRAESFLYGLWVAVGRAEGAGGGQRAYLARLIDELGRSDSRRVLVVDDVHRLVDPGAIAALGDLIRYLPRSARLILAARHVPDGLEPTLDRCAVQNQLRLFTWDDLRLDDAERAAAAELFGSTGSDSWILARSSGRDVDLAAYMRREFVAPLDRDTLEALTRLAALPSFDVGLASAVTGLPPDAVQRSLERVYRETPLLETVGGGVYRFGESARALLLERLGSDARRQIDRAAGLALRPLDPTRSAESLERAGEMRAAAESLGEIPLLDWLTQSSTPAHELLARLPADAIAGYPGLMIARAWGQMTFHGEVRVALALAAAVPEVGSTPGEATALTFWKHYLLARGHLAIGDVVSARADRDVLRRVASEARPDPRTEARAVARQLSSLSVVEALLDDLNRAIEVAQRGLTIAALDPDRTREERLLLHHVLGNTFYRAGEYERAMEEMTAAIGELNGASDPSRRVALIHVQSGIARCRGQYVRALELLDDALAQPLLAMRERALATLQAGHVLVDLGDFRGAGQRYRTVASWLREPDRDGCYNRALAGLAICCDQLGLAGEATAIVEELRRTAAGSVGYDLALAEGVHALVGGDPSAAERHFAAAVAMTGTPAGRRDSWQAVLLQTRALLLQNRSDDARQAIEAYLDRFATGELPSVASWVREPVEALLAPILEARQTVKQLGVENGHRVAERTSPRLRHAVREATKPKDAAPRSIEVRLFGPPAFLVDGVELPGLRTVRQKARELLFYAALNPEGFARDEAQADLFPEQTADRGRASLQVAASELRTLLSEALSGKGTEILTYQAGRYQLNLANCAEKVVVDTRALASLDDGLRRNRQKPPAIALPGLFRGELLAGWSAEWVVTQRRYWTRIYLRTLDALATRYDQRGDPRLAIRCHDLILNLEPTQASSHRALLKLYHRLGDASSLEAQLWLYRRVLRDELGLAADPAVDKLYHELIGSPA